MKQRITKANLERMAENCNREAPAKGGWKYAIDYAYGRPRLVLLDSRLCCRDISPRLSTGDLAKYIWAFLDGVRAVKNP